MTKLNKYILDKYEGKRDWFVDEVKSNWHYNRIMDAISNKEYLAGKHKINKRVDEVHNGKVFKTKKMCLQYAKTLLEFETAFLLKNPATLISNNLDVLEQYKKVYREGKYSRLDYKILNKMVKQGEVYEYIYIDENRRIKSMLFDMEDSYPVYSHTGEMIGFIHYYIFDNISYYTIYDIDTVTEWTNKGGELYEQGQYTNASGLPIAYVLSDEMDELRGKASFREYIDILDSMEELISKNFDAFYKFLSPTPIFKGNRLNQKEGGLDKNAVGFALQMTEDSDFKYENAKMDYQSLKEMYKILKQSLLDISMTPGVSMNSQEISNVSETSIKMLYGMAEIKGAMNSMYLLDGFESRWGKMKGLLRMLEIEIDEDAYIDCQFNENIPQNDKELVENITKLRDSNVMTIERAVEVNPYTLDVNQELELLKENREV